MPVPSEIYSVDTLQVLPAADAFVSGELLLPEYVASPSDMFLPAGQTSCLPDMDCPGRLQHAGDWSASPVNWISMAVASILVVLYMRRFVTVLPYLVGGIFRWKKLAELEYNMRLSRDRDALILPSALMMIVYLSLLDVLRPSFMEGLTPGMKTAATFGVCTAFFILRGILILVTPSRKIHRDTLNAANGAGGDFLIMAAAFLSILVILRAFSPDFALSVRTASYYVTGILWIVFLIRKKEIIAADAGQLQAFLYLCSVEILPAVLLVASMMFL
ncbi:MAG: DUF4271 domain-containing protein [Candidatus Cryptobacteroides sp.]